MSESPPVLTYFKAVRLDGTDLHSGAVRWLPRKRSSGMRPRVVRHPSSTRAVAGDDSTSLTVCLEPTSLPVSTPWPFRLCLVEPSGDAQIIGTDDHNRHSVAWRVVGEVEPYRRFGPLGEHVAALIECAATLTAEQIRRLEVARDGANEAASEAARAAAKDAVWDGLGWDIARAAPAWAATWAASKVTPKGAARAAAWDAAWALLVRDLISAEDYDILARPWRTTIGPFHPDDKDI